MKNIIESLKFIISSIFIITSIVPQVLAQDWKTYPYHEDGSLIYFPDDEGWHSEFRTDSWYTFVHLTGVVSGTEYTCILINYKYCTRIL